MTTTIDRAVADAAQDTDALILRLVVRLNTGECLYMSAHATTEHNTFDNYMLVSEEGNHAAINDVYVVSVEVL